MRQDSGGGLTFALLDPSPCLRLDRVARPVPSVERCGDSGAPSSTPGPTAADRYAQTVLGRPGDHLCIGPPAPPNQADALVRDTPYRAALALRSGETTMDLPPASFRSS